MRKIKNYQYIFTDGYFCYTAGKMQKQELYYEELKHGKCISIREVKSNDYN